nr:helix-turn-helix transcriptional regulator [uncultured Lachnoclostridium sp.]
MTREKKIGLNFRYARLQTGVQIKKFAESVDDIDVIISNFERGIWVPSFRKFVKWCITLNASLDRIVYGNDYKKMLSLQRACERMKKDKKYQEYIFDTLIKKREEKGLSLSEASKICNISYVTLYRIEQGYNPPSERTLFRLCELYGFEILEAKEV